MQCREFGGNGMHGQCGNDNCIPPFRQRPSTVSPFILQTPCDLPHDIHTLCSHPFQCCHHIILQFIFNFRIGEFYARTFLPLHHLMTVNDMFGNGTTYEVASSLLPWEQDIQFYVHPIHDNHQLLEGHKLLLSGMLSR